MCTPDFTDPLTHLWKLGTFPFFIPLNMIVNHFMIVNNTNRKISAKSVSPHFEFFGFLYILRHRFLEVTFHEGIPSWEAAVPLPEVSIFQGLEEQSANTGPRRSLSTKSWAPGR